jgi:hypothetical protein
MDSLAGDVNLVKDEDLVSHEVQSFLFNLLECPCNVGWKDVVVRRECLV